MLRRLAYINLAHIKTLAFGGNHDWKRASARQNFPKIGWPIPRAMQHNHNDRRKRAWERREKFPYIAEAH
jgi:hypothetical protein